MDETYFLQILSMFFFSVWKTYIGPLIAVSANFSYWEMLFFNLGPAITSASTTLFFTDYISKKRQTKAKGFSRNLRKVLRIWKRYGRNVSLILAPILIGIPSYALIARKLKRSHSIILFELSLISFVWCTAVFWAGKQGLLMVQNWI